MHERPSTLIYSMNDNISIFQGAPCVSHFACNVAQTLQNNLECMNDFELKVQSGTIRSTCCRTRWVAYKVCGAGLVRMAHTTKLSLAIASSTIYSLIVQSYIRGCIRYPILFLNRCSSVACHITPVPTLSFTLALHEGMRPHARGTMAKLTLEY